MTRPLNRVYADMPTSVFEVMSQLAREHNAINLGQGFPDDPGPEDVRRKAAQAFVALDFRMPRGEVAAAGIAPASDLRRWRMMWRIKYRI